MCLFPIKAEPCPERGRPTLHPEGSLKLPCGKCHICISKRAIEWATRARHEMSDHEENSFITLTYAPEHLRSDFIIKSDFQKFMKRLRKKTGKNIRYMVSYEYGSQNFRPHMHAILFGYSPPNQKHISNSPSGHKLFISSEMEQLWNFGYHSIGEANEQTAYYIASYALKGKERTIMHPNTGEEVEICDTMDVSKRPGIGLNYFLKNYKQMLDTDMVLPRYYKKKLEEVNIEAFEEYQNKVQENLKERSDYEKFAKFTIDHQKSSLHNPTFRANNKSHKENLRKDYFERRLKQNWNEVQLQQRSVENESLQRRRR
jgi:hypothetical protein